MSEGKTACVTGRIATIIWSSKAPGDATLIGVLQQFDDEGLPDGSVKFKGFMPQVFQGDLVTLHGKWFDHPRFGKQVDVRWFDFPNKEECDEEQLKIVDSCKFLFEELALEKRGEKIFAALKGRARELITKDPYCVGDIKDIGFVTADKIAESIGVGQYDDRRVDAKVVEVLNEAAYSHGHSFLLTERLLVKAAEALELDYEFVSESVERLCKPRETVFDDLKAPLLRADEHQGYPLIYPYYLHVAENRLAERIDRFLRHDKIHPVSFDEKSLNTLTTDDGKTLELSQDQVEAVKLAVRSPISIITGGPGVGKTTIVKKIVEVFNKANLDIGLCSFTGRAARRLRESTGFAAYTIHGLLGFDPSRGMFQASPKAPLEQDVIICDESSMVNLYIGSKLLDAVRRGARVVLVGDADQLPPIGPGAIFRELINSETIPTIRLQKIFRQGESSRIITASQAILNQEIPQRGNIEDRDDFYIFGYRDEYAGRQMILKLITEKIPMQFGIEPEDIQVLCPTYKGDVGIDQLNKDLQLALRGEEPKDGSTFLAGDKVIFTKNNHDIGVMNGDAGRVLKVRKKSILVDIDGVEYSFDDSMMRDLRLAYAISIHKSQGSEYPATITVASPRGRPGFFNANMLYTSVTRGKKLSIVVTPNDGNKSLGRIIATKEKKRNSLLTHRLNLCLESGEYDPTEDTWDESTQREVLA